MYSSFATKLAAVAIATSFIVVAPLSASAATVPELWYQDAFGVADAAAAGFTGQGVKVAVIDGLINPALPALSTANITIREPSYCADRVNAAAYVPAVSDDFESARHGTEMVSLLVGNGSSTNGGQGTVGVAPGATVLYYATDYDVGLSQSQLVCPIIGDATDVKDQDLSVALALDQAIEDGADIISLSIGTGTVRDDIYAAIAKAMREGVVVVAARPNDMRKTDDTDLSGMNGVVSIQAMGSDGVIQASSAVSDGSVDIVGPGVNVLGLVDGWSVPAAVSGTSGATAIVAGYLAIVKSKYPKATGNQLIQSLINNTGLDDHALKHDSTSGYGIVSLRHMLEVDPTKYKDVNPLIDLSNNEFNRPVATEIFGKTAPSSSSPTLTPAEQPQSAGTLTPILIGAGILILLFAALAVLTLVLVRRSNAKSRRNGAALDAHDQ